MNSGGRISTFRSLLRSWTPVTENEFYAVLGLYMLMGIIQNPTLLAYFSRKRILPAQGFGVVILRDRLKLIMKFLHSEDNTNKANYEGPA
jgi:hypothetical protein